jgi:hypothetical protein
MNIRICACMERNAKTRNWSPERAGMAPLHEFRFFWLSVFYPHIKNWQQNKRQEC